jgi:hypothetical protein
MADGMNISTRQLQRWCQRTELSSKIVRIVEDYFEEYAAEHGVKV